MNDVTSCGRDKRLGAGVSDGRAAARCCLGHPLRNLAVRQEKQSFGNAPEAPWDLEYMPIGVERYFF